MKKILSTILVMVMLVSMMPISAFATDEVVADTEISQEVSEIPENYGTEVSLDNGLYYIEDGKLLYSSNNGRPQTIDSKVNWVIEESGDVYYSKLDGYNTYIYKVGKVGQKTEFAKIFCPVECFDVYDNDVYCLYNGEIFKINIDTKEESFVETFNGSAFCLQGESIQGLFCQNTDDSKNETNNVELLSVFDGITYQKQFCEVNSNNTKHISGLCNVATLINLFRRKAAYVGIDANFNIESYFESLGAKYAYFTSCVADNARVAYWKDKGSVPGDGKAFTDANNAMKCIVKYSYGITSAKLKTLLDAHPEGVSIRYTYASGNGGHAILVTRYSGNQFYAVDPVYASQGEIIIEKAWGYHGLGAVGDVFTISSYEAVRCSNCKKPNKTGFKTSGNRFGVCKNCGAEYDFTPSLDKSVAGYYTLKSNKSKTKITLCALPYDGSGVLANGVSGSLEISGCITNAYNNKWYVVEYGDYVNGVWKEQCAFVYGPSVDNNYTKQRSVTYQDVEKKLAAAVNTPSKTVSSGGKVSTSTTTTTDKNVYINLTSYPTDGFVPKSFPLKGTIISDYPIYYLTAILTNLDTNGQLIHWNGTANTKKYNIEGSELDKAVKFNNIRYSGNYRLRIIATNSIGESKYVDKDFYVEGEKYTVEKPTIKTATIEQGQKITVSCSDSNAVIHYTVNGGSEKTGYGSVTQEFKTAGTYNITAWTTKSGYNNSAVVNKTVSVTRVAAPTISNITYGTQNASLTISGSGTIYYTTNGSAPTSNSTKYTGPIKLTDSRTIKAIAVQYGQQSSSVAEKKITVSVPETPKTSLSNTKAKIAKGKTATVKWAKTDRATSYVARLYYNGECVNTYKTDGTTAAFKLPKVGTYTIKVAAKNFKGESVESNAVTVESMAPVTVTIVDKIVHEGNVTDAVVNQIQQNINEHDGEGSQQIEGNVISVQTIDYDSVPARPTTPSKKGFTFAGYGDGLYKAATEDKIIDALYEVNYYTVEFYDTSTNYPTLINNQDVMYTMSADEPSNYTVPAGYAFTGWSVDNAHSVGYDYKYVDGNMKLYTAYSWSNKDLPVFLSITSIVRDDNSYKVNIKMKNNPVAETRGRLVIALYTSEGKNVYTQIRDEDIDLGTQNDWTELETITLLYGGKIASASAFVVAVDNDKTGGALSAEAKSSTITYAQGSEFWSDWSDWSTTKVTPNDYTIVETKTQYRYRDKSTTTSTTTKSLSGWTYSSTKSTTGSWSSWSKTKVSAVNTEALKRIVETRNIAATYKTQYQYGRYANGYSSGPCLACANAVDSRAGYYLSLSGWLDTPATAIVTNDIYRTSNSSHNHRGVVYTKSGNDYWYYYRINGGSYYFLDSTRQVVDTAAYTQYRYKDTTYVHSFYNWGSWSGWKDSKYTATSDRQVETRTVYRYKTSGSSDSEKESATVYKYNNSGVLDNVVANLAGEVGTVMIYKKTNTDPTQEQIEYIGQITIGAGNTWEISANTKEALDYNNTGDFVVTLALEGGNELINLDYIKAPVPTYTVDFYKQNGELHESVPVEEGGSVDVNSIDIPEAPVGHRFVKWDKSVTNISHNISVNAVYEKITVPVVFVDHENETAEIVEVLYGDPIVVPEAPEVEGKTFVGWEVSADEEANFSDADVDAEEIEAVTKTVEDAALIADGAKVLTAKWDTHTYTVQFTDFAGNTVSEQTVAYGEPAEIPEFVEKDGVLYSWDLSSDEWWNVTYDMVIRPYIPKTTELEAPTISVSTEDCYGIFAAELESDVENGKIYFTTDTSITEEDAREFASLMIMGGNAEDSEDNQVELLSEEVDIETSESEAFDITDYIVEYTEPLELYAGSVVYAFSVDELGNISPISVFQYENNADEDAGVLPNEYVPSDDAAQITMPTITANPGESVTIPVTIKNNPGLTNLEIILGYNTDDLTLENVENGVVFTDDKFSHDTREDGSCKFVWESSTDNTMNGTLMNLTFKVNDTATKEKYLLDLAVEYSASAEEETYLVTVPGAILEDPSILGDVNGDGEVDFADGILILKHDVGLSPLDDSKLKWGDVNGDGEVDFSDAILVLKFDVGLITSFKR